MSLANRPFHHAVVRLDVGVLLWRGGLGELLSYVFVSKVLLDSIGHKLATVVVANVKPLGQPVALEDSLEERHDVALPDVPLDGLTPRGAPPCSSG